MTFQISKFESNRANGFVPLASINKNKGVPLIPISSNPKISINTISKFKILSSICWIKISTFSKSNSLFAIAAITKSNQAIIRSYLSQSGIIYSINKFPINLTKNYYSKGIIIIVKTSNCKPLVSRGFITLTNSKTIVKIARPTKGQIYPRRRY